MRALYGDASGFGWKLNEIVGSQIVSVPLDVPVAQAGHALRLSMGGMLATFVHCASSARRRTRAQE